MIRLWLVVRLLITCIFLMTPGLAGAVDPSRNVDQLKQTVWGADRGAPAHISAISQSPDGFLWLATSSGLYRFDGVTFEHIPAIKGDKTKSREVLRVLAARDGSVWVGYLWGGLSIYRNGVMQDAAPGLPPGEVTHILEAPDGSIWVETYSISGSQVSRCKDGRWTNVGTAFGLPSDAEHDLKFGRDGTLWASSNGLFGILRPGARRYSLRQAIAGPSSLAEDSRGQMWAIGPSGAQNLTLLSNSVPTRPVSIRSATISGYCTVSDHEGNLFACGKNAQLFKFKFVDFENNSASSNGKSATGKSIAIFDYPRALMEDRERDIWIGGSGGLIQIKSTNIVQKAYRTPPYTYGSRMIIATDGKRYFGNGNDIEQIDADGSSKIVGQIGLRTGSIAFLCPDKDGSVWAGTYDKLYYWHHRHSSAVQLPKRLSGKILLACAIDRSGDLWLTVDSLGLFRRHLNDWTQVIFEPSRPEIWPMYLTTDKDGRILGYVKSGDIIRIDGGRTERIGSTSDAGVGFVRTLFPEAQDILIGGEEGLSRYDGHRFQVIPSDLHPWLATICGILQTPAGETWLNGAQGIIRVRTSDLQNAFDHPDLPIPHQLFDIKDGLQGSVLSLDNYEGLLGVDGRVWFQTNAGRLWIDPTHLYRNTMPPPVVIKAITADHQVYPARARLVLPSGVRNLQIDYTALSLVAADRTQFRYRLSRVDKGWVDPGARRQAFYTNLNPGNYRFDVIAANNDGVWNKTGATLNFRIRPTFWQTPVFAVIVVLAVLALLWFLYTRRLREMADRIRLRLEDRLAERERIARELHDTLLQGFQGLTMRFQSVAEQIPPTEPTRQLLDRALDRADEVLVEGRDRVRNLRADEGRGELAFRIEEAAYRLRFDPDIAINMVVEGDCRCVHPVAGDEVFAIANEALFNAFKHAQASRIDIALVCERQALRLTIADDGVGIDPEVLEAVRRPGHYGFIGMRERAGNLKAKIVIQNTVDGAEVLLRVPRDIAYAAVKPRWSLFPRPLGPEL